MRLMDIVSIRNRHWISYTPEKVTSTTALRRVAPADAWTRHGTIRGRSLVLGANEVVAHAIGDGPEIGCMLARRGGEGCSLVTDGR